MLFALICVAVTVLYATLQGVRVWIDKESFYELMGAYPEKVSQIDIDNKVRELLREHIEMDTLETENRLREFVDLCLRLGYHATHVLEDNNVIIR